MDFSLLDQQIDSISADKNQIYKQLNTASADNPNDVQLLWRLAKVALLLSDLAEKNGQKDECKRWSIAAVGHAKAAVVAEQQSLEAHKWLCAAVGRLSPFLPTKERIECGHEFKVHSDIARKLDPNDRLLHHMYGRWCYEVASLSWMERKLAATFFGTPPESTFAEALNALEKANELRNEWIGNHLWIAKVLIAMKKPKEALKWIDSGLQIQQNTEEDGLSHQQLIQLQNKLNK
ncbi:regulator of microtubule dynamics protein 2-like [Oppia nitens]|uniref:regulator of microtubule dynamics protein 2-like n=1 Tax=Oppia nitens TaxID=1686743 RepID=UPI0023DC8F53|nr:regulator of microtubule dynamics protein 2-like [Oppia nitens]